MTTIQQPGPPDPARGTAPVMVHPDRYAGKSAVVTGASSGIGRATARRLAAEGAAVACLDIDDDGLNAVLAEIEGAGGRAVAVHCDVAEEDEVRAAVAVVLDALGPPTIVCNIAGIGRFAHTADVGLAEWNRIVAVNLTGTFLVSRALLPSLLAHGGAIVNTSSSAGKMGQPYSAAYCASKGGVTLLTKAMAVEFAGQVRVNAVAPGGVDTPIITSFGFPEGADVAKFDRITSSMGFTTAAEVAGAFAYLGSDEAAYVTGIVLSVDGALTA